MREVGGVGLLPALCRRRTACRRNVLRSRRNMTVSSLPGAVMVRHIIGLSECMCFLLFLDFNVDKSMIFPYFMLGLTTFQFHSVLVA